MEETAVQDPDETIGQTAQRLGMAFPTPAERVVIAATAWRSGKRRVRPQVARVGQPSVAAHPGQHHLFGARGFGDRRGPRIVLASFSMGVAGSVVAELGQNPAAEDDP
jgi:hypothetical protein